MGYGPVPATRKALDRAGIGVEDLDLVELNEAFASQSIVCINELGLDPDTVNVNGGAIALGHPLGMSGAGLITMLAHELVRTGGRYGLATMCIGVGQGIATVIEPSHPPNTPPPGGCSKPTPPPPPLREKKNPPPPKRWVDPVAVSTIVPSSRNTIRSDPRPSTARSAVGRVEQVAVEDAQDGLGDEMAVVRVSADDHLTAHGVELDRHAARGADAEGERIEVDPGRPLDHHHRRGGSGGHGDGEGQKSGRGRTEQVGWNAQMPPLPGTEGPSCRAAYGAVRCQAAVLIGFGKSIRLAARGSASGIR